MAEWHHPDSTETPQLHKIRLALLISIDYVGGCYKWCMLSAAPRRIGECKPCSKVNPANTHTHTSHEIPQCTPNEVSVGGWGPLRWSAGTREDAWLRAPAVPRPRPSRASLRRRSACF